jgi:BASS family bile acid:Na+ symporter
LGVDTVYAVALVATVWATFLGTAIAESPAAMLRALTPRDRVVRVVLLSSVGVPLLLWGLGQAAGLAEDHIVGLVLLGAAGAGPLALRMARIAGGTGSFVIALIVALEFLNLVTIPAWTTVAIGSTAAPPIREVLLSVTVFVIAPLVAGWLFAAALPAVAARAVAPLLNVARVGFVAVLVLAVAINLRALGDVLVSPLSAVSVSVLVLTLVAGWLVGGPDRDGRVASAFVASIRGASVALAVAATAFASTRGATIAIIDFSLFGLVVPTAIAVVLGRRASRSATDAVHAPAQRLEPSVATGEWP